MYMMKTKYSLIIYFIKQYNILVLNAIYIYVTSKRLLLKANFIEHILFEIMCI